MLGTSDWIVVGSFSVAITGLVAALMAYYVSIRSARYDRREHHARLEMMRRSVEQQIALLNDKLLATEARWRDVNHLLITSQNFSEEARQRTETVSPNAFLVD